MLQLLEKKTMRAFLERKRRLDEAERDDREAAAEESYEKEFTKLREMSASYKVGNVYPTSEGEKQCNAPKNRYKDILPFDQTRVKLKNLKDNSANDYVNASYIQGAVEGQTYIASQAPNEKTVKEFWQMIWENNVSVILMACREYEGEPPKLKCQRYWPNSTAEEMSFGSIEVILVKEETTEHKEHFIRHMIAKSGSESRALIHLHYQEWPDKGVPRSTAAILDLIERFRSNVVLNKEKSPALVHCSAGCGRTGTIMVIDYVLSLLKYGKLTGDFSIFEIVAEMRRQRMAIVQSQEQYVFVHEAVAELFEQKLKKTDSNGFGNTEQSGVAHSKPKIIDVNVDYEILESTPTPKRKPSLLCSKPVLPFPGAAKSSDGPSLPVDSCSSMPTLPLPSEPQYAVPFVTSNAKKPRPARSSSPVLYGVVRKDPSNDANSKNEYSYANPYQTDKWSLQGIALGLKQESAYATVNDLDCHDGFGVGVNSNSEYSEINCGADFHSKSNDFRRTLEFPTKGCLDENSGQPPSKRIMNNIFSKLTITNFGKQDPSPNITSACEIAQVIFRDVNISFPNRIAKPLGKRPMPMKMEQTSAVY